MQGIYQLGHLESRYINGSKFQFPAFCLDLEKYIFCLWKSFSLIVKVFAQLGQNFSPKFSKNLKLSQFPSDGLIAIYKSLFEGTLNTPITFESSKTFTVTLDKCRRVGSSKFQPGSQEFDSETIEDIELINDATSDQGN